MLFLRWALPALMVVFIILCRYNPAWAEGYARSVYPFVSTVLSAFSSLFPFSLHDVFMVTAIGWLVGYPIWKRKHGALWKVIILRMVEVLVWIYIWFYMAWGLNYFRYNVYTRLQLTPVAYNEERFLSFLNAYTDSLNAAYVPDIKMDEDNLDEEVKSFYRNLLPSNGLVAPKDCQSPKRFLFTPFYSGVGVLGSMGPFFAEAQLNAELLPVQIPFTYAHEFSHLLGVSNEAEANYWAYRVCVGSSDSQIRFCGYFGLFPYVLSNARRLLDKEKYSEWIKRIRPEVIADYNAKNAYWQERYSPWVGKAQDFMYNLFLKGNRIPSGKKNYAEVIGILLAEDECRNW